MQNINGKVAVITGAGSGIGRATARLLARHGAAVALGDLDGFAAKETADAIMESGGRASIHEVDVSSEEQMRAFVDAVVAEHDGVDIVVNNAGIISALVPAVDVPLSTMRKVVDVNFWGMVYGSLFFLPHLLRRPEANIVNVSSNAGLFPYSRQAAYTASKFGIRGFSETLRMELRSSPVRMTVVYPGSTKTNLMGHSPLMEDSQRRRMQLRFEQAWGRPPEAVAKSIVAAVRKNRARALVGPDTAVLDALARIAPAGSVRLLAKPMEKFVDMILGD